MAYLIGISLALAVVLTATRTGFDRDRSFYPTVVILVASYYVLFAAMEGATRYLVVEVIIMGIFVVAALSGYRRNVWIVVVALAGHGVYDGVRKGLLPDNGAPHWWPAFCASFDVAAAAGLTCIMLRRSRRSSDDASTA